MFLPWITSPMCWKGSYAANVYTHEYLEAIGSGLISKAIILSDSVACRLDMVHHPHLRHRGAKYDCQAEKHALEVVCLSHFILVVLDVAISKEKVLPCFHTMCLCSMSLPGST